MRALEERAIAADEKAKDSEQQLNLMEQRLAAINWQPQDLNNRVLELENVLERKEKHIDSLEKQLSEQVRKKQRQHDAKLVEEKAVKIKEWVARKLEQLEEEKHSLILENSLLREQLHVFRDRYNCLQSFQGHSLYRDSLQDESRPMSFTATTPPPINVKRRSSSPNLDALSDPSHNVISESSSSPEGELTSQISEGDSENSIGEIDPSVGGYQEVDQNHESIYEPKRVFLPQIKIERKFFTELQQLESLINSGGTNEQILEQGDNSSVKNDEEEKGEEEDSNSSKSSYAVTPLTPKSQTVSFVPFAPPSSPNGVFVPPQNLQYVSALATLPRTKCQPASMKFNEEIYSQVPKREIRISTSDIQKNALYDEWPTSPFDRELPPRLLLADPPDSNESEPLYEEVWKGAKHKSGRNTSPGKRSTGVPSNTITSDFPTCKDLYQEVVVPVFATLKGKAAQIRKSPFMDDTTSDSSDDEACTGLYSGQSEAIESVTSPVSGHTFSSLSIRKTAINQSSSGAVKRGVSCHSELSDISCDYALPPDDISSKSDSESSEPEQKILKYATDSRKHDTLEKCGYLSKLGGKVKMWKRKWFVLRNGALYYYKSQHDVLRKPQGHIRLDMQTKINKSQGQLTFEVTNSKKTYYLTADSAMEVDRWVRLINKVVKRQASSYLLDQVDSKAIVRGWLTKVKNGMTRRCWCILLGRYFLYYKTPTDKTPLGQLNLRDARLDEIDHPDESDEDSTVMMVDRHVIAIWPPLQGPTYLIIPTKQEKDSWLYHLTVAAGGGTGNVGTEFEQIVAKVMEVGGNFNSIYWKNLKMLHTKEPITSPLTTLPSEELQQKGVELFKLVYQYMATQFDTRALDYHVTLAQTILGLCIDHPQLQNELFCQLIRQTSRHPVQSKMSGMQNLLLCGKHSWFICDSAHKSPSSSIMDLSESKLNPAPYIIQQGWELLSMCVSLFLPKQSVMWLLKVHLQRNADPKTEAGKYAIFCQRGLERTMQKDGREAKPSRMEVLSILLRHPYHHSQPLSIPLHFLNNTYQVVSFDGSTTVTELLQSLQKTLYIRDIKESGFALFTDDPTGQDIEHCLPPQVKVCDVISKWEQAFRDSHSGKIDSNSTIRFLFKNRLYFKSTSRYETEKEKLLLAYQINEEIVQGRFPLNRDLAVELASLMAQIEFGDAKVDPSKDLSNCQQLQTVQKKFYPEKYQTHLTGSEQRTLVNTIYERWAALRGRSVNDCVRMYLNVVRKWPFCGAKVFLTCFKGRDQNQFWIAVQEEGISLLDHTSLQPISNFDFKSVVTFGGWKDDFMLVVNQLIESAPHHYEHRTEKMLFVLPKPKILELSLLIASYINSRLQHPSPDSADDI
ncbi:pleckstrin homology domain-containing family H member 1 isoform X3 [Octopus sinensis]|nr:pleckstrin homology domain-containing family H member 1 isoform X3 [Octopus sinensis]